MWLPLWSICSFIALFHRVGKTIPDATSVWRSRRLIRWYGLCGEKIWINTILCTILFYICTLICSGPRFLLYFVNFFILLVWVTFCINFLSILFIIIVFDAIIWILDGFPPFFVILFVLLTFLLLLCLGFVPFFVVILFHSKTWMFPLVFNILAL